MPVSYLSWIDYTLAPEGLEYASLLGNQMRLSAAVFANRTTMSVQAATAVALNQFDVITIYDGPASEQVQVASATPAGSTAIPLLSPGFQFNHAQYTPCSSPGVVGDLGGEILKASAWVENITRQSLWSTTQTETLRMPSMRACIDNQQVLTFRTRQYPISAISALSIQTNTSDTVTYDATQAIIDENELVTVPQLLAVGSGSSTYSIISPQMSRQQNAYLNVTYTAGYTTSTIPADIKDAAILLTNALLSRRQNSGGWDSLRIGDKQVQATQRGDNSGEGLHVKNARALLANYTLRLF